MIPTILILCDTIQQVATNATSSGAGLSNLGSIASIFSVFLTILFFLIPIMYKKEILDKLLPHRWRKKYIENNLPDSFFKHIPHDESVKSKKDGNDSIQTNPSDDEIIDGNIYIQPYIIPQTNEEKPTPILLKDYFDKVFVKRSEYPNVYLLLGNSGTGKTAALAHYFYDYINNHTKKNLPYEIRLFSLGQEDVFDCIKNVKVALNANNKKNCILLLDALDENKKAQDPKENESFFQQLKEVFKQFAFVIITCRPQFFTERKKLTNVTTIELAPFNDQQVQDFLDQTFSISYDAEKRSKAAELIKKHYKIASRPIILTYIRDIVESDREINTSLDFYNVIVEKELHRNMKRAELDDSPVQIQRWWDMTSEVAGYMYKQGKTEISYEELLQILINHHLAKPSDTINEDHFQRRSLLTITGDTFHFSHKSFYEYFMAYRFFLYPDEIKQVFSMDFALQLFDELYEAKYFKKEVLFANLQSITNNNVQESLKKIEKAFDSSQVQKVFNDDLDKINHINSEIRFLKIRGYDLSENSENSEKGYEESCKRYEKAIIKYLTLIKEEPEKYGSTEPAPWVLLYYTYNKLLDSYRREAQNNPDKYLPKIAETLNKLICFPFYPKQDANLFELAQTLYKMAELYLDQKELAKAEDAAQESLEKFFILAKKSPEAFNPWVKSAEELLERIQNKKGGSQIGR